MFSLLLCTIFKMHNNTGFKACIFLNGLYSNMFAVNSSLKLSGILSLVLFYIYFDVLINRITQSGYGCYIGMIFLAVFVYAGSVVLLALYGYRHETSSVDL